MSVYRKVATHLLEWPGFKTLTTPDVGDNVEQHEHLFISDINAKLYSHFGR